LSLPFQPESPQESPPELQPELLLESTRASLTQALHPKEQMILRIPPKCRKQKR
jgi:hypothetical protein